MNKNYYETLGVSKNASTDEIKKAYKKMAMKYHPDRNKGDAAAEKKFKEINEAYQVLGDEEKKKNYDTFGSAEGNPFSGGNPFGNGNYQYSQSASWFDFSDIFGGFGGTKSSSSFDFSDIFKNFSGGNSHQEAKTEKKSHNAEKENLDVTETVELPFLDFLFDNKISVRTVYGKALSLKVKAFTEPWTKFRIQGEGRKSGNATGDMFVIVKAKMPKEIPPHIEKMIEAIRYEL